MSMLAPGVGWYSGSGDPEVARACSLLGWVWVLWSCAGGGLGRAYALLLGSRGAKVVVNDLGGSVDGVGGDNTPAQGVVDEIKAAGGEAVPNYDSVSDWDSAQKIIHGHYGR